MRINQVFSTFFTQVFCQRKIFWQENFVPDSQYIKYPYDCYKELYQPDFSLFRIHIINFHTSYKMTCNVTFFHCIIRVLARKARNLTMNVIFSESFIGKVSKQKIFGHCEDFWLDMFLDDRSLVDSVCDDSSWLFTF